MILFGVLIFIVWLVAGVMYGTYATDPAASRYKWLIGWPLALVLIVAALLGWIISLPKRFFDKRAA